MIPVTVPVRQPLFPPVPPDIAAAVAVGATALQRGDLVAFPTETVFGLGADARNAQAVAQIYAVKGRPAFNPLIVHVTDTAAARALTRWNSAAETLTAHFWPGPLTLVLPLADGTGIVPGVTAGLRTLAVRVPVHPVAQALLRACGGPVAAPSANPSGRLSAVRADHVRATLGTAVRHVLEGSCPVGVESTIIDLSTADRPDGYWRILRPGSITGTAIAAALTGVLLSRPDTARHPSPHAHQEDDTAGGIIAPGMLRSHYAPRLPLRLEATTLKSGEALLAFGPVPSPLAAGAALILNLSATGDLDEAARNLYLLLHMLDQAGAQTGDHGENQIGPLTEPLSGIAVMPIPDRDTGAAINDRLRRAAVRENSV
jgi:L-threonylcarbamoyladenylate synthase